MTIPTMQRGGASQTSDQNVSSSSSSMIKAIPQTDVHRITSGQVVLDLQTAVKELIENALDASATNIAINFRDYGAEAFEVVDNGTGIDPSNYASVALKHYTSKLSSFSDLALVRTFGFRGEALSSLCALSNVTIHTATASQAPMGTILKLDRSGRVQSDTGRAARQRGTTITIEGLFKSLPVRRKEFEKNLKREFTKAQNLLQAYVLVTRGVRWTTTNTPAGGRKTAQFSVNSSNAENYLSANVSSLFGAKVVPTLMPLNLELTFSVARKPRRQVQSVTDDEEEDGQPKTADETSTVTVVGLISKPTYGSGRTSSDRQFFYINGRPWEAGRVSRAINEVYKSFNSNHFPFVIADFRLPTDSYDVNVSPDKRTIFLHEESRLIEKVKEALEELFAPSRATFLVNGASHSLRNGSGTTSLSAQSKISRFTTNVAVTAAAEVAEEERAEESEGEDSAIAEEETRQGSSSSIMEDHDEYAGDYQQEIGEGPVEELEYREKSDPPLAAAIRRHTESHNDDDSSGPDELAPPAPEPSSSPNAASKRDFDEVLDTSQASWSPTKKQQTIEPGLEKKNSQDLPTHTRSRREARNVFASLRNFVLPGTRIDDELPVSTRMATEGEDELDEESVPMLEAGFAVTSSDSDAEQESPIADEEATEPRVEDSAAQPVLAQTHNQDLVDDVTISFNLSDLAERVRLRRMAKQGASASKTLPPSAEEALLAGAGVLNSDEDQVERALSRVIHKPDFAAMQVLGQFNLGFIIARRRSRTQPDAADEMDDLFIVDQHASDEKYNFETLQQTTQVRSQKLISPRSLELSASDELVAIEHQATLLANGFEITVSETGLPGTRVKLISQPISKSTVFGAKDLEELLYLLRDTSAGSEAAKAIRCSKARNMFASRACRKSVMIGTALNKARMEVILRNMGTIDQPWNCPHGRPTMRHLACLKTLDKIKQVEEDHLTWDEVERCLG